MAVNCLSRAPHYFLVNCFLVCDAQDILTRIPLVCRHWRTVARHRDICSLLGRSIGAECATFEELKQTVRRIKIFAFAHTFRFIRQSPNISDLQCLPRRYLVNLIPSIAVRIYRHYHVTCGAQQSLSTEMDTLISWFIHSLQEESEIDLLLEINRTWRTPLDVVPNCRFHAALLHGGISITRLDSDCFERATLYIRHSYSYIHLSSQFQLMFADGVNPTEQGFLPAFIHFYIEFSHIYGEARLYRLLESMRGRAFSVNALWPRLCTYEYSSVNRGEA